MSQSRFSIVLVGVSALLRRPLVSRLRPADGERSPWVVFAARSCRFDSGFRSASWPSGSPLPLFGTHRFGDCRSAGWPSGSPLPLFGMCRFGVALGGLVLPPSVSELPLGGLAFGLPLPLFGMQRFGVAAGRVRSSAFRFGVALGGLGFGLTASAFRHAPLRGCPRRADSSARRIGLRAYCFGDCHLAGWPLGSLLPLFGMHRSAPPHRRSEDRRSTTTRHLFHFKTLISTC